VLHAHNPKHPASPGSCVNRPHRQQSRSKSISSGLWQQAQTKVEASTDGLTNGLTEVSAKAVFVSIL
jgi:hypothetical protein